MEDTELERLTIEQLEDLKRQVEEQVRARIRAKQQAKAVQTYRPAVASAMQQPVLDLEQARDAWIKNRAR